MIRARSVAAALAPAVRRRSGLSSELQPQLYAFGKVVPVPLDILKKRLSFANVPDLLGLSATVSDGDEMGSARTILLDDIKVIEAIIGKAQDSYTYCVVEDLSVPWPNAILGKL